MGLLDLLSDTKRQPAECLIEVDGGEIDDLYLLLVEVEVETDRTDWTVATLVLETRRLEDGSWIVQDDDRFEPWKTVKIQAAFGDDPEEVMRGFIKEVRAEYPEDAGGCRVTVTCQDHSLLLDRLQREERWGEDAPTTDGQIATTIAQRNGLSLLEPPAEGQTVQDILQNATDIRFLKERADANGFEIIFREGKLYFGARRLEAEPQPNITVYAGTATNCLSLSLQDDGHQPDKVAYQVAAGTGTDAPEEVVEPDLHSLGETPANSEDEGLEDFTWRMRRQGVSDDTQMEARAQSAVNDASMRIKAEGELDGSLYGHVLRTGEPVGVDGLGQKNSGIYYVDTVTHKFDVDGYRVNFRLSRNAYGDNLTAADNPLASVV